MENSTQELRRAVAERNYIAVQKMLTEGVKPFPRLWFPAIQGGDADICSLLLLHGLDPNISDTQRKPLHFAAEAARTDIAELLLRAGADPNVIDDNQMSPLDVCCEFASDERAPGLIELFLRSGAKVNFATALRIGDLGKVVDHLNEFQDDLHRHPVSAMGTPLMVACRCGRNHVVTALLERGAHVNELSPLDHRTGLGGNSPIWFAAQGRRHGRGAVVRTLVNFGGDVDLPGEHHEVPLHVAVAWRNSDVAIELLELGADPNALTDKGESPVDFAIRMGFREMETMVRAYGGHAHLTATSTI